MSVFNTKGWVWEGDVSLPVQSVKLKIKHPIYTAFSIIQGKLSTCTCMNGG